MINGEETQAQFKERILSVVKTIIENGLTMRDGELKFGLKDDMPVALDALASVQNEDDLVRMRDASGTLLVQVGGFINHYSQSQMKPEKMESLIAELKGENPSDFATAFREKFLNTLGAWIKTMHENGLDQNIKPRRWDSCNGFGSEPVACHDPYRDVFPQKRRDREARQGGLHLGLGNK